MTYTRPRASSPNDDGFSTCRPVRRRSRARGRVWPVIELSHSDGNCSITGGVVVRDGSLPIAGRYVVADFCKGQILSARLALSLIHI